MATTIYLKLRNEGTDVWRPVEAERISNGRFRILTKPAQHEDWPVEQTEIVECERHVLSGGECWVVKAN